MHSPTTNRWLRRTSRSASTRQCVQGQCCDGRPGWPTCRMVIGLRPVLRQPRRPVVVAERHRAVGARRAVNRSAGTWWTAGLMTERGTSALARAGGVRPRRRRAQTRCGRVCGAGGGRRQSARFSAMLPITSISPISCGSVSLLRSITGTPVESSSPHSSSTACSRSRSSKLASSAAA
jgi:hypothetical protein